MTLGGVAARSGVGRSNYPLASAARAPRWNSERRLAWGRSGTTTPLGRPRPLQDRGGAEFRPQAELPAAAGD